MPKSKSARPYSDQSNWSNTYLTDPELVKLLGPFDLDPCCPPRMPWRTAKLMLTDGDVRGASSAKWYYPAHLDGLEVDWKGRVFMNPPYRGVLRWARKFVDNGNGIALLNGRSTETRATQLIMKHSQAIYFPSGRLTFYRPDGNPFAQKWFPSLLIGMTLYDEIKLANARQVFGGELYKRTDYPCKKRK